MVMFTKNHTVTVGGHLHPHPTHSPEVPVPHCPVVCPCHLGGHRNAQGEEDQKMHKGRMEKRTFFGTVTRTHGHTDRGLSRGGAHLKTKDQYVKI